MKEFQKHANFPASHWPNNILANQKQGLEKPLKPDERE